MNTILNSTIYGQPLPMFLATIILATIPVSLLIIGKINNLMRSSNKKLSQLTTLCFGVDNILTKEWYIIKTLFIDQFQVTNALNQEEFLIENLETKTRSSNKEMLFSNQSLGLAATAVSLCHHEKTKKFENLLSNFFKEFRVHLEKEKNMYEILEIMPQPPGKKITTVVSQKKDTQEIFAFSKGNPKEILARSSRIIINGKKIELTKHIKAGLKKKIKQLRSNGEKVIAFAYKGLPLKKLEKYTEQFAEHDLIFIGMAGMTKPVNLELISDIEELKQMNIKTYILTSVNEEKAVFAAKKLGVINENYYESITGRDLEYLLEKKLPKMIQNREKGYVFSELKIEDKENILNTIAANKETALYLKSNLHQFVEDLKRSRAMNVNFKKYFTHAFSGKIGLVVLILISILLKAPIPFTIAILLLLEIAVNFSLELSLRMDISPKPMENPNSNAKIPKNSLTEIFSSGIAIGIILSTIHILLLLRFGWEPGETLKITDVAHLKSFTGIFLAFSLIQIFRAISINANGKSIFRKNPFHNHYLLLSFILVALISYAVTTLPFLQDLFHLASLSKLEWQIIILASLFILFFDETKKLTKKLWK